MKISFIRIFAGFSLVEVVLALGIFAFAITSVLGLLPVALQTNKVSFEESRALNIIHEVVADVSALATNALSPIHDLPSLSSTNAIPDFFLDEGHRKVQQAEARYRVSVRYDQPASGSGQPVGINLRVSWPAVAPTATPLNRVETYLSLYPES